MAKLVTYNTLVRVGRAILTEAQASDKSSINSLTGEFKGYIDSQDDLSSSILAGDFYIASDIFSITYGDTVVAVATDSIIIATKNNPNPSNREDWVIIKSTVVDELLSLKESLQNHISNKNNPHDVSLIQANGEDINDSTFSNLLNEL